MAIRPLAALALASALAAVACGGGADADSTGSDDSTHGASGGTIVASSGTEFAFDATEWTVPAGEVTVEFTTTDDVPHSFAVVPAGVTVDGDEQFDTNAALLFVDLPGKQSGSDTATLEAGTYQVICTVPGHFQAGMEGQLTVTAQ